MWQGPNNGVLAHTDISDAGFVAEAETSRRGSCPQEAAQIAVLSMFGPR